MLHLVGLWVKILEIPKPYLFAGIMTFALLGTYAGNGSTFDVVILLVLGATGYLMRRFGFPVSPIIVGAILGPLAEVQLRRALDIAGGRLCPASARGRGGGTKAGGETSGAAVQLGNEREPLSDLRRIGVALNS